MKYKLSSSVEVGNRILLSTGWEKIVQKFDDMVVTEKGTEVKYGGEVLRWKIK